MIETPAVKNGGISLVSLARCVFSSLSKATTAHRVCVDLMISLAFMFICIGIISGVTFY